MNNCYFLLCATVYFPNYLGIFYKMLAFQSFLMGGVYPAHQGFLVQQSRPSHRELPARRPTALWEETAGDLRRDGASGAEHRGSQWLHLPPRADPRPVSVSKVRGPDSFEAVSWGTLGPPSPALRRSWAQRPPAAPLHSTPTSLA